MALLVNNNVSSLLAQYQLSKTDNALKTSIERLSSGLRVNSAADDAAGYAISNRMSSIISGLATSIRNANDGISYSQTVTGALGNLSDNFQRMRELAIQSLNGDKSNADKDSLEQEYNQLLAENMRIQATTNFNGKNVFSNDTTTIQVGYRNTFQDRISLDALNLSKATAISPTRITETPTTTQAYDLGVVINAAKTTVDGMGNSTATYETVRDAVLQAINDADKIGASQKTELSAIVNNLYTTEKSINAGVSTYANDLNKLMGASIVGSTLTPTSPINASISGSSLSAINSIPSISTSISNVISIAPSGGSVSNANAILQGILANPYITGAGNTAISNAIAALFNQYQNSSSTTNFVNDVQNVLLGSNSVTPSSVTFTDGLTAPDRTTLEASTWFTTTFPTVLNDPGNNTKSLLQSAMVNSINASSLSSGIKSALTTSIGNLSTFSNTVSMSLASYQSNLQNLITNGTTSSSGINVTLAGAGIAAIASTPSSTPSSVIGTAINNASATYSAIYTAATTQVNNLRSSGIISSTIQSNLNTAITTLFNQSNYPTGANTTVPQFTADLNQLVGSGATGSVGPFSTGTSFQVSGGTFSQLQLVPIGVTATQNATSAINKLDEALDEINQASAQQGAFQNRLTAIISDLKTFSLSQSSAQSRIRDADFASETTLLTKNLMLQETGSAMLAQANSSSEAVITLLQSNTPLDTVAGNSLLPSLSPSGNLASGNAKRSIFLN